MEVLFEEAFLNISWNCQRNTCVGFSFLIKLEKETLAIVFCCEFCMIHRTLAKGDSAIANYILKQEWISKINWSLWRVNNFNLLFDVLFKVTSSNYANFLTVLEAFWNFAETHIDLFRTILNHSSSVFNIVP